MTETTSHDVEPSDDPPQGDVQDALAEHLPVSPPTEVPPESEATRPAPDLDALPDVEPVSDTLVDDRPASEPIVNDVAAQPGRWVSLGLALVCSAFVFFVLRPELIFSPTTPAGGDMGAHVWGPAYMRDELLSRGRLVGWTPDWYAGFPAYHYYMVVPALFIVAVNTGFVAWLGVPLALLVMFGAWRFGPRLNAPRGLVWSVAAIVALLLIGLPYGTSFKLVSVLGLIFFPLAAWFLARQLGSPEPVPGFAALGATVFLFDTNFWIYGGNIPSTLAGEFAFSLSLCLTLVALGWAGPGMASGSRRASAAVLIALAALSHVIPMFFLVISLFALVLIHEDNRRGAVLAAGVVAGLAAYSLSGGTAVVILLLLATLTVVVSALVGDPVARRRGLWLLTVGPVAALLSFFWLVPFYLREPYFNDMGWERRNDLIEGLLTTPMRWMLPLAGVGVALSVATRTRLGQLFTVTGLIAAGAFVGLPEGKLWNARVLPFYYLSVYLLAAVAVAWVVRVSAVALSERVDRPDRRTVVAASMGALVVVLFGLSVPLRLLPFGQVDETGAKSWLGFTSTKQSMIPGWVEWNYSGYEDKSSFREYHDIVGLMDRLGSADTDGDGEPDGCGRTMWEYDAELDRYGTPMALMLLPFWTESCITSMEGLYFESSATTPFHFLNQSVLSAEPSRAQRDLPYRDFDLTTGVAQLQVMGVRYYLALSDQAQAAAAEHPDLTEVGRSEPWVVYEVAGSAPVAGLDRVPVVASGPTDPGEEANRFDEGWLSQAVVAYNDPVSYQNLPAEDGPATWKRVTTVLGDEGETIEPTEVTNIAIDAERIRFEVDEPGRPVLVKTSYFPNWSVEGADGPWRAGPNLMVVIPTANVVELRYGYTWAEYLGYGATLVGLIALGLMATRRSQPA